MIKTPLYDLHLSQGARMVEYAGYALPVQVAGTLVEHTAARQGAALFDTSHMGRLDFDGTGCTGLLDRLLTCRVATLPEGRCRYGLMLDQQGGIRDDAIVYRLGAERFRLVVNGATRQDDIEWIAEHRPPDVRLVDRTLEEVKIDLQGPGAPAIAVRLLDGPLGDMRFFDCRWNSFAGRKILISRTGYTGEIGFELYMEPDAGRLFWQRACECGAQPAGLGARDTLRLEAGLPLYGHELSREIRADEANLDWAIDRGKDFIGAAAIRDPDASRRGIVGLRIAGRSAARAGDDVLDGSISVGRVTSGSFAPSLGYAVAFALVNRDKADVGTKLVLKGRRSLESEIVPTPFYRDGTARRQNGIR